MARRRRARKREGPSGTTRRWKILFALAGGTGLLAVTLWNFAIPRPGPLDVENPTRTALMEQRLEEAEAGAATLEIAQEWVPLDRISPNLVRAVVVAEDYRFYQHRGIDWVSLAEEVQWTGDDRFSWTSPSDLGALRRAMGYVWAHRNDVRGRSTITQQLAKNLYFGTDRTFLRKALELVVARRLERRLDKRRILELYLNVVEWGPGVFGAEAASRHYFGRPASQLSLEQAAELAGTLPHPLTSNPSYRPGQMLWRKEMILDRIRPPEEPAPAAGDSMPAQDTGSAPDTTRPGEVAAPDTLPPDTANTAPIGARGPVDRPRFDRSRHPD